VVVDTCVNLIVVALAHALFFTNHDHSHSGAYFDAMKTVVEGNISQTHIDQCVKVSYGRSKGN
jgi:hypothetical protein